LRRPGKKTADKAKTKNNGVTIGETGRKKHNNIIIKKKKKGNERKDYFKYIIRVTPYRTNLFTRTRITTGPYSIIFYVFRTDIYV